MAEFQKAFPYKRVQDVLYFANTSRSPVRQILARKLEKGKTPVWNCLFAYEYPVNGAITAFHCSEIVEGCYRWHSGRAGSAGSSSPGLDSFCSCR